VDIAFQMNTLRKIVFHGFNDRWKERLFLPRFLVTFLFLILLFARMPVPHIQRAWRFVGRRCPWCGEETFNGRCAEQECREIEFESKAW
jgi:hypothetical protein